MSDECVSCECVCGECVSDECVSCECVCGECVSDECVSCECVCGECVSDECVSCECVSCESVSVCGENVIDPLDNGPDGPSLGGCHDAGGEGAL